MRSMTNAESVTAHICIQVEQVVGLVRHMLLLDVPGIQAVAAEGSAKLMLAGKLYDAGVSAKSDQRFAAESS